MNVKSFNQSLVVLRNNALHLILEGIIFDRRHCSGIFLYLYINSKSLDNGSSKCSIPSTKTLCGILSNPSQFFNLIDLIHFLKLAQGAIYLY